MDEFERIKIVLKDADNAIRSRDLLIAVTALQLVKPMLAARIAEGSSFSAIVTMQATLMSLLAGNLNLAQEFATMVVSEVANMIEKLCGIYQHDIETGKLKEARSILHAANIYTLAFVPYAKSHPRISFDQIVGASDVQDEASAFAFIYHHVRPKLDSAGWASWSYPQNIESKAKYWSARALVDFGRMLMDNVSSGRDIQDARFLAENGMGLLQKKPHDQLTADTYNLLGRIFNSFGDQQLKKEKAVPFFEQCIDILEEIGNQDDAAVDRSNLAAVYIELARFAKANNDMDEAAEYYQKAEEDLNAALSVHRTCKIVEHLPMALVNLGGLYSDQKIWDRALETYLNAWAAICKAGIEDSPVGIGALVSIGYVLREQGKLAEAETRLRQAVVSLEKSGIALPEPEIRLQAYGGLGVVLHRQKKWAEAYKFLDKTKELLESYRNSFVSENDNLNLIRKFRYVYEALIDCCTFLGNKQPELNTQAFNLAEKIKWRSLIIAMRFKYLQLMDTQSESLIAEEERLLKKMSDFVMSKSMPAAIYAEVESIKKQLEEIWIKMEPKHPEYVAIRRQKTIEAQEVASLLDEHVSVLVEYYLGDEFGTSLAFIINKNEKWPKVVRLETSTHELYKQVEELHAQDDSLSPEGFNEISNRLYNSLIEPIWRFVPEDVGVCIVPYGKLHNIPFGVLYDGNQYLIQRNPIVITPSATGLRWWMKKNNLAPHRCLIFTATSKIPTAKGMMPDLDMVEESARNNIVSLFMDSKIVQSKDATKQNLLQELTHREHSNQWDVVYIGCHGVSTKKNIVQGKEIGFNSYLVMAGNPADQTKDLTALEIAVRVHLQARLVTLSACETGIAQTSTGDEIAGLAQSFLFGGASSVLASIWYVRQDVGVEVMRRFYELWIGNRKAEQPHSKIKALQIAQIEALQKKKWFGFVQKWSHPYLWGAFQLYGDWR